LYRPLPLLAAPFTNPAALQACAICAQARWCFAAVFSAKASPPASATKQSDPFHRPSFTPELIDPLQFHRVRSAI